VIRILHGMMDLKNQLWSSWTKREVAH
jgi:hypothetical protein